jgi:hypothetical protein
MKRLIHSLTAAVATFGLAGGALAQPQPIAQLTLGLPETGGTGCPEGTVSAVLSPDGTALSILYDTYFAEAGGTTNRSFDRKSCNVAIPVNVPNGISVSILAIDYRGFNQLPQGARSTFRVEYFFAGSRGPIFNRTFTGPLATDYLIENDLIGTAIVWSGCGEDVILRTNSSILVQTAANQQALATVDTQDVAAALIYHLQFRPC